jgi:hypothetical protein
MSGWALFQMATTLSMFGTQVQKLSVTFWPADEADEADAGVLLDDEEHPAATLATSTAASARAQIRAVLRQPPGSRAPRRPRRRLESFIAPPGNVYE